MKKKNDNKFKVYYTVFDKSVEIDKYFRSLSNLIKLNYLYEKNLLSKSEYEKVKCAIGFNADF